VRTSATGSLPGRLVLIGHPVSHSLSPVFQQAALDHLKIPLRYETLDVSRDDLRATVEQLKTERAAGNVTLPHKAIFASLCNVRSEIAERAVTVNTFWIDENKKLVGDNTDVAGFQHALRRLVGAESKSLRVLMLGSGGAAAGAITALAELSGVSLTLHARNTEAAAVLGTLSLMRRPSLSANDALPLTSAPAKKSQLSPGSGRGWFSHTDGSDAQLEAALAEADLIVNATSLGIEGQDELPLAPNRVPANCAALDLTYRRSGTTPWVAALRERGVRAEDGITMLLEQGALAFERWFGVEAPRAVMKAALGR
jgi:shikimate dehydrogenase